MFLTSTLYEKAGDRIVSTIPTELGYVDKNYTWKHVVTGGSFRTFFPNTDESDEYSTYGNVWPTRNCYQIGDNSVIVESLEDNSEYHCVLPNYQSDRLVWQVNHLSTAGETRSIPFRTLAFVFGQQYTVNGSPVQGKRFYACERNGIEVQSVEPCKIIEFTTITLDEYIDGLVETTQTEQI
jgi:hypothetical protein